MTKQKANTRQKEAQISGTKPHDTNSLRPNKKRKAKLKTVLLVFSLFFVLSFGCCFGYFALLYNRYDLDINKLTSVNNGIKVYSASGSDTTLYNSNRSIVQIENLPNYVPKAFIDVEDKRFYAHHGYDLKRIVKAMMVNLTTKSKTQGASTISQQLVKNALLSNEKTYERKLKEIVLSIKMEKKFDKLQILEMYLNTIYFGQNAYGIENASQVYFNKSAQDLTLSEACCLAGIIKSPAKYSPKTNPQNALERRNLVAKIMLDAGDITQNEYEAIIETEIVVANKSGTDFSYEREAIYEACSLLNITERELINADYQIVTNKDDEIQKNVIEANNAVVKAAEENTGKNLDSVTIVAKNNGEILAYYANSNYNLHNMKRQAASALKPFAVYLPCFEHNILSPATQINDEPIDYDGFAPQNAGGGFSGYVSTREAISKSLNIPAVKALDYVGLNKAKSTLSNFGFNIGEADMNLSLALGATQNGVGLLNLACAYSTLANLGEYRPMTFINKILNKTGEVVYSKQDYAEMVSDAASCYLMTDCLRETAKTGTAKRLNELGLDVASKTGTANNGKFDTDLYNIAYTSEHTTLTWLASVKDNKLDNLYSSSQPTEINKQILASLYANYRPSAFEQPEGVVRAAYDVNDYLNNHSLSAPTTTLERYIAYDYFKLNNTPEPKKQEQANFVVTLNKTGSYIYFDAEKTATYEVIKAINGSESVLSAVSEKCGKIELCDKDIFKHDEIIYILKSNNNEIAQVKIRPKDYFLKMLEEQMLNGKSRWFV